MPQAQQLGRYLLLDRIAFGGMAEIFRAKTFDEDGQAHLVAVKRVLAHLVEDDEFLQMIVDEARVSALLHHPNIAELYEFGHAANEYFLAMEYVDGKDLRAVMERVRARGGGFPLEHAIWVAMGIAHGLHAAHVQRDGRGQFLRIVHRDVSPSNVLCGYDGAVKLCDFGIAKATLTRIQTKTGVIKGKVKYMSPEQALGRKLDHRSDLFSLGTVLYEMLALAAPFSAATEVELIFAVREAKKRPITDHRPDVPASFNDIIDKAMSRSRGARYQSGDELAADLARFLEAYKPGYRGEHFARFLRTIFQDEVEHELRHLEEYELDLPDISEVGENLIADALGDDAPFAHFTPLAPGAGSLRAELVNASSLDLMEEVDGAAARAARIHQQPTLMIDRQRVGLEPPLHERDTGERQGPAVALAAEETQHRAAAAGGRRLSDEQTRLLALPELATRASRRSIHDEVTGRRLLPVQVQARLADEKTGARLLLGPIDLATGIASDEEDEPEAIEEMEPDYVEGSIHDELTKLISYRDLEEARMRDPSLPPPQAAEPTMLRRRPLGIEDEGAHEKSKTDPSPGRPGEARGGDDGFGEISSVPLADSDLYVEDTARGSVGALFESDGTGTDRRPEASQVTSVPLDEADVEEVGELALGDADLTVEPD